MNTQVVDENGVSLPEEIEDSVICYACPFNKQRNATLSGIFHGHLIGGQFLPIDSIELPPDHTVLVEADIQSSTLSGNSGTLRVSREMRDRIISTCGDSHIAREQNKKIDS